jgi:hypothetical protein
MTPESLATLLKRVLPAALTATVIAVLVLTSGCTVSTGSKKTGGTYHGHGISFKIPDGWRRANKASYQSEIGTEIWSEGFAPAAGNDAVLVTAYSTHVAITRANADRYASAVSSAVSRAFESAGGTVSSGPTSMTMGGLPGYGFETSLPVKDGGTLESRLALVWKGKTEYYVNCQHEVGSNRTSEIERGCKTITSTFKLD